MQIAGPVGAVAGAVIGGGSNLLGWLFGPSKLQRELTNIGQINDMVEKNISALSSRTSQLVSTAGSGNFLEELNGQIGQINEQLGYISGQEVYAQQIYNPAQYKKAGARSQAQQDLNSAMSNLASQKAELANA